MHEIVYLQLGNLSNYIGAHFWNAQDAYGDEEVDTDVSWSIRERITGGKKAAIYRPRLLLFDLRKNLGGLENYSIDREPETTINDPSLGPGETWGEQVETLTAPLIPQSRYLEQLETDQDENTADQEGEEQSKEKDQPNTREIRYWSDFSHVRFVPESIQALAFIANSNSSDLVSWSEGLSTFERYDADMDVMDGPLRQLVEECDSLQGFQGIEHSPTMGGFSSCLSERIVDEYPKVSKIQFTLLDGYKALLETKSAVHSPERMLSNVLSLRHLSYLYDVAVPLNPYEMWPTTSWRERVSLLEYSDYAVSAIYAAHIESITWGTRCEFPDSTYALFTKKSRQRGAGRHAEHMVNRLNKGRMPFACLGGIVPMIDREDPFESSSILDLTLAEPQGGYKDDILSRYSVLRGTVGDLRSSNRPSIELIDPNPYPLPLSHPKIFMRDDGPERLDSVAIYSTLQVRRSFGRVLEAHTTWCDGYMRRRGDIRSTGMEVEEILEILEELRAVETVYRDEQGD